MNASVRFPKVLAHLCFVVASAGFLLNVKHYCGLKAALHTLPSLAPLNSSESTRFFSSPPLSFEQKKLLDTLFTSHNSESASLHSLVQTTMEGWLQSAGVQGALWFFLLVACGFAIWRLHRSNPALQPTDVSSARRG